MENITVAITAASYSGNKGAAAMLQSSISQLKEIYGDRLRIRLMSVYPAEDVRQCPHPFVDIVPAQPWRLVFFAFPCAVCCRLFSRCAPLKRIALNNNILRAFETADLALDEAGIAFSDSRGAVMNLYAFICGAVPLLMGVPLVKYSQASGPFRNPWNRLLASIILPEAQLVIARGKITYRYLCEAGFGKNVKLCADGAFTMPRNDRIAAKVDKACRAAGCSHVAGICVSSVVNRRCEKAGTDYIKIMAEFILHLTGKGYQVMLIANAARIHSARPRNNDLLVADAVYLAYQRMAAKSGRNGAHTPAFRLRRPAKGGLSMTSSGFVNGLWWEHREMDAEEILEYIAHCEFLVASRFHAMVFALSGKVPVMLTSWNHKYEEVMAQFGLEEYVTDYKELSPDRLCRTFEMLEKNREEIRRKMDRHLPAVRKSSGNNIRYISQILNHILESGSGKGGGQTGCSGFEKAGAGRRLRRDSGKKERRMCRVIHTGRPGRYLGNHIACRMGYATDSGIRELAASGGMVTALFCSLLKNGDIDGAWVVKTAFTSDGKLTYHTYVATTPEQIRQASSSVYMNVPWMSRLEQIRRFSGRLAVVLTPCMMKAFRGILEQDQALRKKIVLCAGLFCGGGHDVAATEFALDHSDVSRRLASRLYYRTGHWRGRSRVLYKDGSQREFSYKKSVCAYKNAFFFQNPACFSCKDQFGAAADISFGDVWLSEVKKEPVKYTGCVIRTRKALNYLRRAQEQGDLVLKPMTDIQMLYSQKRALTFKYRGKYWNHRLAGYLAVKNQQFSFRHPKLLKRVPMPVIYYYMCLIRVLLSW